MKFFKQVNNITGWAVFLVALITYTLTLEATTSFWDCGEFISGAYKMQVVHPPGAPVFLLIGRIFTLFAFDDPYWIAWTVNFLSGLTSAFAVLFLFWITTGFARKVVAKNGEPTKTQTLVTIATGVIAALACTFTDTIWFSAVEGEVYAMSLFFMMLVFWCMMKWESSESDAISDRWLVLIFFLLGVSSGVHLLSFLAIPAMALIFYFKRVEKPNLLGVLSSLAVGVVILGFFFKGIVSKMISIIAGFELTFTNDAGLGYGSGFVVFAVLTLVVLLGGLALSHISKENEKNAKGGYLAFLSIYLFVVLYIGLDKLLYAVLAALAVVGIYFVLKQTDSATIKKIFSKRALNTLFLSLIMVFMGFSTYFIVIIRANADTPINMNRPSNVFALESYLNREQYGDRPLLYGPHYDAYPIERITTGKKYVPVADGSEYKFIGDKFGYRFDPKEEMLLPRMGSWQNDGHKVAYRDMVQPDFKVVSSNGTVQKIFKNTTGWQSALKSAEAYVNSQPDAQGLKVKDMITERENMSFFFSYQVGVMYLRYFMWNFSGRQNDLQGRFDNNDGNWITGIPFIDDSLIGPQDEAPDHVKNNFAHNKYFLLPFLLGLLGMVFHFKRDPKSALIVLALFMFAGVLQVVYLNSPPFEPRERDYTLVGSFVTFCLWIGFGMLAIYSALKDKVGTNPALGGSFLLCLIVPVLLGTQNWDDHDRSERYTARDYAINYLESCAPNAVVFTQGDNDTYPLWYVQEVEGVRTDVRVVNLSLLGVDWYVEQLNYKMNDAAALKLSHTPDKYLGSNRDYVQYFAGQGVDDSYKELSQVVNFIASDDARTKVQTRGGESVDFLPATKFKISVDKEQIIANNVVPKENYEKIVPEITWDLGKGSLLKNDLITLDIIANNLWERPIYFAVSVSPDAHLGLTNYLQLEGLSYRIVPVFNNDQYTGYMATDIMLDNVMTKFQWGGVERKKMIDYKVKSGETLASVAYDHNLTVSEVKALNSLSSDEVAAGQTLKLEVARPMYMDENILRMTMNLRSNFGRLAEKLMETGRKEDAAAVLDKCLDVLPLENVPYNLFMIKFPDIYYKVGEVEKARLVTRKMLDIFEAQFKYSTETQAWDPGYQSSRGQALAVVQELLRIATANNDTEMKELITERANALQSFM